MTVRFIYTGPMPVGFDSIHREVHPDEEFDVPDGFALSFANHGFCRPATDADAAAVQALRDAEAAEAARQDEVRAAAAAEYGLANAHPNAPQYEVSPPAPEPPVLEAAPPAPARVRAAKAATGPAPEAAPVGDVATATPEQ